MTDTPLAAEIILNQLCVSYGNVCALKSVSGHFSPGSLTAIVGPNGGGKSTLVKAILQNVKASRRSISFKNLSVRNIAYMPQRNQLDQSFPITVKEVAAMGLIQKYPRLNAFHKHDLDLIQDALTRVGLSQHSARLIDNLSGGQFQRLLFARILLQNQPLIILDEPFSFIDLKTKELLLELIQDWHKRGKTIIIVLHELDLVEKYFPQTLLLARSVIQWGPTKKVLTEENITIAFKTLLLEDTCTHV